jgi:hypothetical protein
MAVSMEGAENAWANRGVKLLIVTFVLPIIVLTFHQLLILQAVPVDYLLLHFGADTNFWVKTISLLTLLPSCLGAAAVCKWIWPSSK